MLYHYFHKIFSYMILSEQLAYTFTAEIKKNSLTFISGAN